MFLAAIKELTNPRGTKVGAIICSQKYCFTAMARPAIVPTILGTVRAVFGKLTRSDWTILTF